MKDIAIVEKNFIDKSAAEYLSRGYEVFQDATLDFLPGFRADLVVRKGDDNRVIAVKTRTSLVETPELDQVAETLKARPGWSLELLLVGEPESLETLAGAEPFSSENIHRRIHEAEKALDAGSPEAAFLLAWSACEATVRVLLAAEGFEIDRVTQSGYVLGNAVFHGAISDNDDAFLSEMLAYRNAIVHGFEVKDFDAERTKKLIAAAKKLHRACIASERADGASVGRDDLLDPLDVRARLDELRAMQDGWLDGYGKAPSHDGLAWLSTNFERHFPDDLPLPHVYPTPEGGIEAEWPLDAHSVILEILIDTHQGEWLRFSKEDDDDEDSRTLNLEDEREWNWVSNELRQAQGVTA